MMIINYDELIDFLEQYSLSRRNDVSPRDAVAIRFPAREERNMATFHEYKTADGRIITVDLDKDGLVLSIEVV